MMSPVSTLGQNEAFWVRHLPPTAPLPLQTWLSHVIICFLLVCPPRTRPSQAAFQPHRKWMNEWMKCFHWTNELKDTSVFSGLFLLLAIYTGSVRQPGGRAYFFYRQDHGMKWVTQTSGQPVGAFSFSLPCLSLSSLALGSVPWVRLKASYHILFTRDGLPLAGNSPSKDAKAGPYLHSYTSSSKQGKDTQAWGCKLVEIALLSSTCFWSLVTPPISICFPHLWSFENIPPPPSNWL